MSFSLGNSQVICNGPDCQATADIPIGLRPTLSGESGGVSEIAGWLFTVSRHGTRHFCPQCLAKDIGGLRNSLSKQENFE